MPYLAVSGGRPGEYRAWVTPTRPGAYTFRITGLIRGQGVDESFTENDVEEATNIAFPVRDPSTAQLATRVDREASARSPGSPRNAVHPPSGARATCGADRRPVR